MTIEEEITETIEEAVEEATEKVAEEAGEAVEEVGELADSIDEEGSNSSPVEEVNEALEMTEQIRSIAREEAEQAIRNHEQYASHGETVHIHEPAPEPEPEPEVVEDVSPLEALMVDALPTDSEKEKEEDEEPTKEHRYYKPLSFGRKNK